MLHSNVRVQVVIDLPVCEEMEDGPRRLPAPIAGGLPSQRAHRSSASCHDDQEATRVDNVGKVHVEPGGGHDPKRRNNGASTATTMGSKMTRRLFQGLRIHAALLLAKGAAASLPATP